VASGDSFTEQELTMGFDEREVEQQLWTAACADVIINRAEELLAR
jgi:hypothetical protein